MLVIAGIGVEIGARAIHRDLAQQARLAELVQRVIDGGERHRHARAVGLFIQHFGGDMAIAARKQQPAKPDPLARRAQARMAQFVPQIMHQTAGIRFESGVGLFRATGRSRQKRSHEGFLSHSKGPLSGPDPDIGP